jgi:hypothetical protein
MLVRQAVEGDILELVPLMVMESNDGAIEIGASARASLVVSLVQALRSPEYRIYVAEKDEALVGFVTLEHTAKAPWEPAFVGVITRVYVVPEERKSRALIMLLRLAMEEAAKVGYDKVRFFRDAGHQMDFLEKHGWKLWQLGYEIDLKAGER